MTTSARRRAPVKPGFYTVPDDPATPPQLMGTKCPKCGEAFFPKRVVCAKCMTYGCEEALLSPKGTLYSYTWVTLPLFGSTEGELTNGYGVGQVDMPEGPRVQFPLSGKQEEYKVGMALDAELVKIREDGGDDVMMYSFRPAGGAR